MDITSTGTQNRTTKLAIGALFAPEIPHVPGIGINPHNIPILMVSDILMDPVFGEIFKEFSIEQGFIDTQKEPELGLSGNRGLENARIRDVGNLGPAMVRGGFFNEGARGGDGSERQTRAMVVGKNVISSTVITARRSSGSGVISICECCHPTRIFYDDNHS